MKDDRKEISKNKILIEYVNKCIETKSRRNNLFKINHIRLKKKIIYSFEVFS